jgi:hypothetical protein
MVHLAAPRGTASALFLSAAIAPGCAPHVPRAPSDTQVYAAFSFRIGGVEKIVARDDATDRLRQLALTDQAARDLGCAADRIRQEQRLAGWMFVVEGCGARAAYLEVMRVGDTRQARGFEGRVVRLVIVRFIQVSGAYSPSGIAELEAQRYGDDWPSGDPTGPHRRWRYQLPDGSIRFRFEDAIVAADDWIGLNVQAARDLSCPRSDVVVEFLSRPVSRGATWPVAEGCGKRALFVRGREPHAFEAVSIVPIAPAR